MRKKGSAYYRSIAYSAEMKARKAADQEARERCIAIFGKCPKNYGTGNEDAFGTVARVYCVRAYNEPRIDLKDHEWIALWHKHEPETSLKELLQAVADYIGYGCGIAG